MKPEGLIFDIDGTLWDSTGLVAVGYNLYLTEHGLERYQVTAKTLKKLFGKTMSEIADALFADIPAPERYDIMVGCMDREHQVLEADPCAIAYPGVVETLKALSKNYRLFIVSNSQKGYPQLLIDKLGLGDMIEGHLCFGDTGTCKGQTIRTLMAQYGITSAVYIGDTQGDLEACELAGLPFIFCRYGFGKPERWDAVIDSFDALPNAVQSLP